MRLVIIGSGCRGTDLRKISEPKVLSWTAKDIMPWVPIFGTTGSSEGNELVRKADKLLILGCRMNPRQIGYGWIRPYTIMVDIDMEEILNFDPDECYHMTVKDYLANIYKPD